MARIRTIKPEFPQSESIGNLSREARLLFILLWTVADDHGRCRAAHKLLAGQLYPYDDDAAELIPAWLDELEGAGLVARYTVDDSRYLEILGWGKHQRIDNAGKSTIPPRPDDISPRTAANRREPPLDLGPRKGPRSKNMPDQSGDSSPAGVLSGTSVLVGEPLEIEMPVFGPPAMSDAVEAKIEDDFEEWYRVYPRHVGRGKALKAYRAALKKVDKAALLEGAKRARLEFTDPQFTPHPASWLNAERWSDERGPPKSKYDDTHPKEIYRGVL